MIQEEEKYKDLIRQLKTLPKVRAKKGFEERLKLRLLEVENAVSSKKRSESLFERFLAYFRPSFVPAVAVSTVVLIAIIVYFSYFVKDKGDNISGTNTLSDPTNTEHIIYLRSQEDSYVTDKIYTEQIQNKSLSSNDDLSSSHNYRFSDNSSLSPGRPKQDFVNEKLNTEVNKISSESESMQEIIKKNSETEIDERVFRRNKDEGVKKDEKTYTKVYDEAISSTLPPLAKAHNPIKDSSKQDTVKNKNKNKKLDAPLK